MNVIYLAIISIKISNSNIVVLPCFFFVVMRTPLQCAINSSSASCTSSPLKPQLYSFGSARPEKKKGCSKERKAEKAKPQKIEEKRI